MRLGGGADDSGPVLGAAPQVGHDQLVLAGELAVEVPLIVAALGVLVAAFGLRRPVPVST